MGEMQEALVNATMKSEWREIYKIQQKIVKSFSGRALAVLRVVMNSGAKTPGIDNEILKGPKEYYEAIEELGEIAWNPQSYKTRKPLRRVYIPKPGKKEKRPRGIPTVRDRIVQALYHLAIDPIVESRSDKDSYGFRKERSTHDAIRHFMNYLDKPQSPR